MRGKARAFVALGLVFLMAMPAGAKIKPRIRYIEKPTPPYKLDLSVQGGGIELYLDALILPGGPGSWVVDALWDEYVVTIINKGDTPVSIDRIRIIDPRGVYIDPGNAVIQVEDMSRDLMDEYAVAGVAYVLASTATYAAWGLGAGTVVGGVVLAPLAVLAAPAYIVWKRSKQRKDRERVDAEFNRRLLGSRNPYGLGGARAYTPVPGLSSIVKIGPGGSVTGSNFFPTIPNPETMVVEFSRGDVKQVIHLPIRENIEGIHVPVETLVPVNEPAPTATTAVAAAPVAAEPVAAAPAAAEPAAPAETSKCTSEQRTEMAGMGLSQEQIAAACGN